MAIYSDDDHGSIFQIKNDLSANSDTTAPSMHTCTQHRDPGGFLIKVTWGRGETETKVFT